MADGDVVFTNIAQHPSPPNTDNRSNQYNVNKNGGRSSTPKSTSTKRILIGVSAVVIVIIIILCIVLPVTLTHRSNSKDTTSAETITVTASARRQFLTKCQSSKSISKESQEKIPYKKVKMPAAPERVGDRILMKNTYMVEFASDSTAKNRFRTVTRTLKVTENIEANSITERSNIDSPLFSGVSFTVNVEHSIESIEAIEGAIALYPVYMIQRPKPEKSDIPVESLRQDGYEYVNSYNSTGITQVRDMFNNYGKGVRVAVIDDGIYYLHPALGGCFGVGCKVAFGYDMIGDDATLYYPDILPDNDPLDTCSDISHGTHVAGIIVANTTGIMEENFTSYIPFIGVAPQVTLGAYRVFSCSGFSSTDVLTEAIYRAYNDKADIINLSLGGPGPYEGGSDAVAAQRVAAAGVYVVISAGNSGRGGLQTTGAPANAQGVMSIGSIDSQYLFSTSTSIIIAPNGKNIVYTPSTVYGGWKSSMNLTIIVNNATAALNDGCSGPLKSVLGAVVLFLYNSSDSCNTTTRCNLAALQGAAGCLLYNINTTEGATSIPTGGISLADGMYIIAQLAANASAIYTFTSLGASTPSPTVGTPSSFTSIGLTGDLFLKPQISGIGGNVYSTISPYVAALEDIKKPYSLYSGTSMAAPYVSGIFALFLASLGNPSPSTASGYAENGVCRPSFSTAMNIFQSTAQLANISNQSLLATAAQQGAGLANAYRALTSTILISPSELSLNDTARKASSYKFNVTNIGNSLAKYKLSHQGAALATGKTSNDDQLLATPRYSSDYAAVTFNPNEFELGSGEIREITLQFTEPTGVDSSLLPVYSGFVHVTNQINGEAVHLTYTGVVGDYKNTRIIVRNTSSLYKTGVISQNTFTVITQDGEDLDGSQGITIRIVLAWSTRSFVVEVSSANDSTSLGVVYIVSLQNVIYLTNAPRNTVARTQTFTAYDEYDWYGHVYIVSNNTLGSANSLVLLPAGQYRLRFSALLHFGNDSNPNDVDRYYSPIFTIIY